MKIIIGILVVLAMTGMTMFAQGTEVTAIVFSLPFLLMGGFGMAAVVIIFFVY